VKTIIDVAGRRPLTRAQDGGRVAFSTPHGTAIEATNEDGVRLFTPGLDGFDETNWLVWPG
jgi:hypothetical protein